LSFDRASVDAFIGSFVEPAAATSILDIGCGRGLDLLRLGAAAPQHARLTGVDASTKSIEAARAAAGDDPRFTFIAHDISAGLPFGDGQFDCVLSVNLLECVPDKQRLLREVHRVLAADGTVVFAHFDWDSQVVDGHDKDLVRRIVHTFADWKQAWMDDVDAWIGRRLWRTFQTAGLFQGAVHASVLTETRFEPGAYGHDTIEGFRALVRRGMIRAEEYDAFRSALDELAASDRFLYAITMYVYAGVRRAV